LAEAQGATNRRAYHLSAAVYRRLGEPAAYVRQRGFEPLQQEQMVLQYVQSHGSIARNEVVDLCQIGTDQAKRLLRRLVREGKIVRKGIGRGIRYEQRPQSRARP
jgi:ATP-dependent DNA helicase RecG